MKGTYIGKRNITLATILLLIILSWIGALDKYSDNYTNESIIEAGSTYAVARGINAIVSVIQSSTITGGVGVKGSVTVGEVLDPMNDLIERFSEVMTVVLSSLVLQKVLLVIASNKIFSAILTGLGILSLLIIWKCETNNLQIILKAFLLFVVIRFSLVVVVMLNSSVDQIFLSPQIKDSDTNLRNFQIELKNIHNSTSLTEQDFSETMKTIDEKKKTIEDIKVITIPSLQKKLSMVDGGLAEANKKCDEITNNTPWTKRFTSKELDNAQKIVSGKEQEKEHLENQIEEQEDSIQDLTENITSLEQKINGGEEGLLSSFNNIKKNLSLTSIENKVTSIANNIINLLVLYILKSILIPLSFFYLFIYLVKSAWRMSFVQLTECNNIPIASDSTANTKTQ